MAETLLDNMFLIEIRLGRTKWRIKRTTEEIARVFSLGGYTEKHPHVTLFGPFSLMKGITVPHLLKSVEIAAKPFASVPFLLDGYDMNQGLNGAVIAYRVIPTDSLSDLNEEVSAAVSRLAQTVNIWDTDPDQKWFHVTIANRLDRKRGSTIFRQLTGQDSIDPATTPVASRILNEIRGTLGSTISPQPALLPEPPLLDEDGLRISVINGDQILAEYDLVQHRWFSPRAQHAAAEWQRSLKQFRRNNGMELQSPQYSGIPDTYLISDLHLGHANIIRYCSRPFPHDAADEMDGVLIRNWNYTVKAGDHIYHLGDLCYGPLAKSPVEYIRRLNGTITFLGGNHDSASPPARRTETLLAEGIRFTLVHDPKDAPEVPGNWVIHGHHHNNDLIQYPFINFENRRINVSAEVVGYRPVSLTSLCHEIKEQQVRPGIKSILVRDR
jgi:calcineurin-like phosphoesterase family protein